MAPISRGPACAHARGTYLENSKTRPSQVVSRQRCSGGTYLENSESRDPVPAAADIRGRSFRVFEVRPLSARAWRQGVAAVRFPSFRGTSPVGRGAGSRRRSQWPCLQASRRLRLSRGPRIRLRTTPPATRRDRGRTSCTCPRRGSPPSSSATRAACCSTAQLTSICTDVRARPAVGPRPRAGPPCAFCAATWRASSRVTERGCASGWTWSRMSRDSRPSRSRSAGPSPRRPSTARRRRSAPTRRAPSCSPSRVAASTRRSSRSSPPSRRRPARGASAWTSPPPPCRGGPSRSPAA